MAYPTAKEYFDCQLCGDDVPVARWELGYHVCRACGDQLAHEARLSWCVVQEYGKGPYQFVTSASAPRTLLDTNQKSPRS
jgi:ribosomal protein L37AE/L43A